MNQFQLSKNVTISGNKVWIDGKELPLVPVKSPHSITQIDNKVYIDGFEFKNGKWRRTIKAAMNLLRLPYYEPDELVEIGKTEILKWLRRPAEEK